MTPTVKQQLPMQGIMAGFRRFSVAEYHGLIRDGYLTENDNLELIEGYLVHKMARNPPHDYALSALYDWFFDTFNRRRYWRIQLAATLTDSEPEPDFAAIRGRKEEFRTRHPSAEEIDLVVEVADSSLETDQSDKIRVYARSRIAVYWIVNIPDRRIEVYTDPTGPAEQPSYASRTDFPLGSEVPVIFDGVEVGRMPVAVVFD